MQSISAETILTLSSSHDARIRLKGYTGFSLLFD